MWRKPGYEPAQPTRGVIERRGTVLAAIPRGRPGSNGQHPEELRVSLDEYQGHPFVGLRLFRRGQDGQMYPVKGKGCSVRLGEAEQVAVAIIGASKLADSPNTGRAASRPVPPPASVAGTTDKAPWED